MYNIAMSFAASKYIRAFQLALSNEIIYRFHFLLGVVRNIIFFATLIFIYKKTELGLTLYSTDALIQYTIAGYIISSLVFCWRMSDMASDILKGDLSIFLARPINYIFYGIARVFATRLLLLCSTVFGLIVIRAVTQVHLPFADISFERFIAFIALLVGALILISLVDVIAGSLAFWSPDTGLQWLTSTIITFVSGAFIPIDALPQSIASLLFATPFPSLVYAPASVLIGVTNISVSKIIITQWWWIACVSVIAYFVWTRGLRRYEASGQ